MAYKNTIIAPIISVQLEALAAFAAEQFAYNFAHLYEPEHLMQHLEDYFSPAYFEQKMRTGSKILVAMLDGESGMVVGYVMVGPMELPHDDSQPGDLEIKRLYVCPSIYRQGVGRQLMQQALTDIPDDVDLYLGVWSENFRAQAFYQSFGFEKVGEYDYIVGPHTDHEFIFKRGRDGGT